MQESKVDFKPTLGLLDATMIVAGSMIGSGIFIVSSEITRSVGGAGYLIAMWILTGVVTIIAAVSYGELSAMFPKAGGMYVYLREAYGSLVGFLYGWTFFTIIQTGTIAGFPKPISRRPYNNVGLVCAMPVAWIWQYSRSEDGQSAISFFALIPSRRH